MKHSYIAYASFNINSAQVLLIKTKSFIHFLRIANCEIISSSL